MNINWNLWGVIGAVVGVYVLTGPVLGVIDPTATDTITGIILGLAGGGAVSLVKKAPPADPPS